MIASDGAENQVTFAADDASDRLAVTITGKAAKTMSYDERNISNLTAVRLTDVARL